MLYCLLELYLRMPVILKVYFYSVEQITSLKTAITSFIKLKTYHFNAVMEERALWNGIRKEVESGATLGRVLCVCKNKSCPGKHIPGILVLGKLR